MEIQASPQIQIETLPFLNISLYLKGIKPIQSLRIKNPSESDTAPIEVVIAADHPFIEPFRFHIPFIPSQQEMNIPLEKLEINRKYLDKLSETQVSNMTIEIIENETVVSKVTHPVNIQPLEHFGGFQIFPELIATYITPNHPYVYHIKRKAIEIIEKEGLQTAFEGYQSNDPLRVLQIMSAIYTAIQQEEIIYSALPPGYEETGQRLRLLHTINREKFGNCIDLSLLFAACFEAVDLNPILIIVRNHAFVACWLQDNKFSQVSNDDKTAITKRLSKGIRELAAIEATSICKGNNIKFSDALSKGEAQLVEKEEFILSIDIKRARTQRIRPLPLLHNGAESQLDEEAIKHSLTNSMENHFEIGTIYQDELLNTSTPATKQKIWERKLLDLSLRNNLLNIRWTRNMLQLVDIEISHLEDTLSEGKSFSILPNPDAEVYRKYNRYSSPLHHSSPTYQTANEELRYNRLHTYFHEQDLERILTHMHKSAKIAIEENGSSTLFLGVGLLKWYEHKRQNTARLAPILLLPVEISRRSVKSKFKLKSREEETMINITLIEYLRQEYKLDLSSLENLPYDDKGVDVDKVMGFIRRAVMQLKGWDVLDQLVLGNFSFNKLILWKDIVDHQEKLLESDMVRSLVEGRLVLKDEYKNLSKSDLDSIHSGSLVLPIDADVSQMEATLAAKEGRSFILHGPPGTGKSQTITNIIADALYDNKRVLFVAAKKAALDVVHKRLEQIGLAPFTLELHSNKSKKSDVLEQLARSIETSKFVNKVDFELEAQRLDRAKEEISEYVNVLHAKQPVGWSLYDCITSMEKYRDNNFSPNFISKTEIQNLTPSLWQQWSDWIPQFQSIANMIIHPSENPLAALNVLQYSPTLGDSISIKSKELTKVLSEGQELSQLLVKAIHFPFSIQSKSEWDNFIQVIGSLSNLKDHSLALLQFLSIKDQYLLFEEWSEAFEKYQNVLARIIADYHRDILKIDLPNLKIQWKQAQMSWFLPKWLKKRKIKKLLSLYKKVPAKGDEEVEQLFTDYQIHQETIHLLNQNIFEKVRDALSNLYKEEQTNLDEVNKIANAVNQLNDIFQFWGRNALSQWLLKLEENNYKYIDEITHHNKSLLDKYLDFAARVAELKEDYKSLTGITYRQNMNWLEESKVQIQSIDDHIHHLKDWMNYVHIRSQGTKLNLHWLINAYEDRRCRSEDITDYFHYITYASIAHDVIGRNDSLSLFNVSLFESKIAHYKRIAKDFKNLTREELRLKLAEKIPNTSLEAIRSSEIGILQRAIKSKGRGISIRRLFDQIPALLPRIAPCMLMSPISVAQYFDVNTKHFDLVIFDEASQLPTCEAVSALARASQAIIVGDPKQMPPTSFFTSTKLDEENLEIEDLESILDDCLALSVPSKYLLRHYRSKHESLIAFSNANYYDNKLLTFPSADDLNRKVKYHQITGYYDKGRTRTNQFEASAIVDFIHSHYSDSARRNLSLGVVTFSQVQQALIEEKLYDLFMSNPLIEEHANEGDEPIFIKNLENVQGDERDIILFSICYAPDKEGKMSMNFGPLNRNGGWRRLNVAITRARYEMHLFATLKADQIDLSRTAAEGVAGLKAFLQFAESGQLGISPESIQDMYNSRHLSEFIRKRLIDEGFKVKCNIGTSGYKLDLGIIHPDKPHEYILGIILDGHYYYNAHTANDREMVMPSVLQALGWNIHRIWTMDWFENSDRIIKEIIEKVKDIRENPEQTPLPDQEPIDKQADQQTESLHQTIDVVQYPTRQKEYNSHEMTPLPDGNSETIYYFENRNLIKDQITSLVNTESPISKNLLYKKLLDSWNISRAGGKLNAYLDEIVKELQIMTTAHHQPFYWNHNRVLEYYRNNETENRNIDDIAPEEILVALQEIMSNCLSIEESELIRHLARTFGFSKVGRKIDTILRYVIDMAEDKNLVIKDKERIRLVTD